MNPAPTHLSAPDVCLLREAEADDAYLAALRAAGFSPRAVPVLRFAWRPAEPLREALAHAGHYGGLVVTSPRAVEALAEAMAWLPYENVRWHSLPVFAVGPATADALRAIGFDPVGADSGSAELLSDHLVRRGFEQPLLFLSGNRRRDTLPQRLTAAEIPFEELTVYETHLRSPLDLGPRPDWLVFFSPSGYEAVQMNGLDVAGARLAAIGETTAQTLRDAGLEVAAVAEEPSPEGLVQALRAAR